MGGMARPITLATRRGSSPFHPIFTTVHPISCNQNLNSLSLLYDEQDLFAPATRLEIRRQFFASRLEGAVAAAHT
jgi:hypothetical protein